jgi:threonine/homoserine/homoserine lactone efflux protein
MPLDPARLALFLTATLALTLTPGPAVLFIVTRSLSQGRRTGFLSVLGIGLGNAIHCLGAALGLAALLASSPLAFSAVKVLGAGYLVWLGLRRLAPGAPGVLASAEAGAAEPASGAVLRQAFTVAVLNPKTALFFLAFLPQFATPGRAPLPVQLGLLGALFVAVAVVTDSGYALLAGSLGAWLRRHPGFARGERFVSAAVYLGLGAVSALARAS